MAVFSILNPDMFMCFIAGGHLLHEAGVAESPEAGQKQVHRVIRDGKAKKVFEKMLRAQGVEKSDLKSLLKARKDPNNMSSVLPVANYFTHLSCADKCGSCIPCSVYPSSCIDRSCVSLHRVRA